MAIAIFLRVLSIVLWATFATRALPAALARQRDAADAAAAADGGDVVDWTPAWTWGAALALSATALVAQCVKLAFILAAARRVGHLPHVASCGAHRRLAQQLARTAIKATVVVSPLSVAAPEKAAADGAENPQWGGGGEERLQAHVCGWLLTTVSSRSSGPPGTDVCTCSRCQCTGFQALSLQN